jgi:hypothetical protein
MMSVSKTNNEPTSNKNTFLSFLRKEFKKKSALLTIDELLEIPFNS